MAGKARRYNSVRGKCQFANYVRISAALRTLSANVNTLFANGLWD